MLLKKILLIGIITSVFSVSSFGQFTVSGEYRPRAEYRHGFSTLATENQSTAFFIDQRTRLNLHYKHEKYEFKTVFQDIRTWGSQSQLVSNDGALTTIHEAWVQIKIADNIAIKIGRQEINYDDARILGNVAWAQQARSHDAVIVKFSPGDNHIDLGLAFNQDGPQINTSFYTVPRSYKTFQYLRFHRQFENLTTSVLFLNNGRQGGTPTDFKTYFSQTIGTHLSYKVNKLKPSLNFYYQTGMEPDGETDISALQYELSVAYNVSAGSNVTVGIEHLSGNSQVNPDGDNKAFNPFYGTNHKFNGLMDYFYVGNHINSVGLQDIFFKLNTKLGKIGTQAHLHLFNSDEELLDPVEFTGMDKYLGTEIDLIFNYQASEQVNLKMGYSQMFATESMEALRGGDRDATSNWAWAMLTIKPTFFTTKKDKDNAN